MATLTIQKLSAKTWKHTPSDGLSYILTKFYVKSNGDKIRVCEFNGALRSEYLYSDVIVYDIGGTPETFVTIDSLMQRLEALDYTGFFNEGGVTPTVTDSFLYQTIQWKSFANTYTNFWLSTRPYYTDFKQSTLLAAGTGLVPNSTFYSTGTAHFIPTGYIVDSIELEISFIDGIIPSNLQIYIDRSEVAGESTSNGVSNSINLVNESITISSASNTLKYFKSLTVASHSLPTLEKSFLQIGIRETSSTNREYCLNFNVKYKKV